MAASAFSQSSVAGASTDVTPMPGNVSSKQLMDLSLREEVSATLEQAQHTDVDDGTMSPTSDMESPVTEGGSGSVTPSTRRNRQTRKIAAAGKTACMTVLEFNAASKVHHHTISRQDLFWLIKKEVGHCKHVDGSSAPQLMARDLRKLDYTITASSEPALLVREHVLLLIVDPMRAVILQDRCIVVFGKDDAEFITGVAERLKQLVKSVSADRIPFEFEALEFIMSIVLQLLNDDVAKMKRRVEESLLGLRRQGVTTVRLDGLRVLKNEVNVLESRAHGLNAAVTRVLETDEDMFLMQLTRLREQPELLAESDFEDHDDSEIMLEAVLLGVAHIERELKIEQQQMDDTEQLLQLRLNKNSNRLLTIDLTQNFLLFCINVVATIMAMFGASRHCHVACAFMSTLTAALNLTSGLEQRSGWFKGLVFSSWGLAIGLFLTGLLVFRHLGIFFK